MFRIVVGQTLRTGATLAGRQLIVPKNSNVVLPSLIEASSALPKCDHVHQHQLSFCRSFSDASNENENDENKSKSKKMSPDRDRRIPVDVETSIKYMKSDAFKQTYKDYKIWELFRRNFKGSFSPAKPRIRCVENGFVKSCNPCVICRDRYLVLHYTNLDLIAHFISPDTGYVYPNTVICLCMEQYEKLCVATTLAKNHGLIDFEVPHRHYDYSHYYRQMPANFVE